jgi:hypothetical protein
MLLSRAYATLRTAARSRLRTSRAPVDPEPPIYRVLLNTLPKSGSVFLFCTLSESLRLPRMHLGNMYSLVDQISLTQMRRFIAAACVSQNHLAPSAENIQILKHFGCRLILHLRDPRQALLSWVHHLDWLYGDDRRDGLLLSPPYPPVGYFGWDFARKLDWQIDNYLPHMIDWIDRWVAIHDEGQLPILLTSYAEFCRDIEGLCERICAFCDIPPDRFDFVEIPKTIDHHFRLGDDSEWRRVYSAEQADRANAMVPPALANRLGWLLDELPGGSSDEPVLVA